MMLSSHFDFDASVSDLATKMLEMKKRHNLNTIFIFSFSTCYPFSADD